SGGGASGARREIVWVSPARALRGPDLLAQPPHERPGRLQLGAHALVAGPLVKPCAERIAARDGQLLHPQPVDPRVVRRVSAVRLELAQELDRLRRPHLPPRMIDSTRSAVLDDRADRRRIVVRRPRKGRCPSLRRQTTPSIRPHGPQNHVYVESTIQSLTKIL